MGQLPLWMGEVPRYEVINGNMQVMVGEFALAMPINVFLVGCAKGKAAIVQWERERRTAEVVALPVPRFERVYKGN
jgi:hypothetical protein